jgi:hypothetical protein
MAACVMYVYNSRIIIINVVIALDFRMLVLEVPMGVGGEIRVEARVMGEGIRIKTRIITIMGGDNSRSRIRIHLQMYGNYPLRDLNSLQADGGSIVYDH